MKNVQKHINAIISENDSRNEILFAPFNPISGLGSVGERCRILLSDFVLTEQWIPIEMMEIPFVRLLVEAGSISTFLKEHLRIGPTEDDRAKVAEQFIRLRYKYDFPFWAASTVKIHDKEGGDDVLFVLRYPQRILISRFEEKRRSGLPIRLILLKARQWGGSTLTLTYYI